MKIQRIDKEQLYLIKPLWEQLNEMHLTDSHYFKDHYGAFTFEKRCEKFKNISSGNIRIDVIKFDIDIVGYCISTIENSVGELDSLFIEDCHRGRGYGHQLAINSLSWFNKENCVKVGVSVAEGHESVFSFYERYGFYPRLTYLQLKV